MIQQGQVFKLASAARDGGELWAFRYRTDGRTSKRIQRGGFASEHDARAALERALERLRRANGSARMLTLAELVERYLAQHEVSPVTLEKLRSCSGTRWPPSASGGSTNCSRMRSPPGG